MASITNTHDTALGLPNGVILPPGAPTNVDSWDEVKDNAVVKAWQKAGILKVGKDVPAKDEKAELQEQLDERGIEYDKRWGAEKLRELLAEAGANPAQGEG